MTEVGVWNDYSRLRDVAVGMAQDIVVPTYNDAYPEFAKELTRNYAGQPAEAVPVMKELVEKSQVQLDYLAKVYQDHGVFVHRPRKLTKEESAYQSEKRMVSPSPCWHCRKLKFSTFSQ